MIRTGDQYREGLRDGREVWIDGERVTDVTTHPALKPIVDVKARMYDMQHEEKHQAALTYVENNERHSVFQQPPTTQEDWHRKWNSVDLLLRDIGGVATRLGDETVGEMWSLQDGRDILAQIDPRFADNIDRHIRRVVEKDIFHVSANTDPKGDRSVPVDQRDPDMMIRVVRETDAGIVIRGAKFETASPYADQAYLKPTVGAWTDEKESIHAVGCIVKMGAPGVKHICRAPFATKGNPADIPLASRFDEVEALMVLDDVLIPWEDVFFYRHTAAAQQVRATLHRYSAFPYVLRVLYTADMMIGAAMWNAKQTGLEKLQAVQEKLADLVCYREGIRAHLIASIATAERSPAGLLMPNQSILYAGRVLACSQLPVMMHTARELIGGQICVTPDAAQFNGGAGNWLQKFYTLNKEWGAEDRRKLLAFARDLLNSDYAGHRLAFVQFAQAPHFNHLAAVYKSFDFSGPLDFVRNSAGLSDRVLGGENPLMPTHTRIRPFNTKEAYPEQSLDNDVCMAVRAGNTVYLRGQTAMDLDGKLVGVGDAAAQAENAMRCAEILLREAGSDLSHVCKIVIYITDRAYREPVYRVIGKWLKGVYPVSTGIIVNGLAKPEYMMEIDIIAEIPPEQG